MNGLNINCENIDPTKNLDPTLRNPTRIDEKQQKGTIQRTIQASLPLLYLYSPWGGYINAGLGGITTVTLISHSMRHTDDNTQKNAQKDLALLASKACLALLHPKAGAVWSQAIALYELAWEYKEKKLTLTDLMIGGLSSFCQATSTCFPRPALIAAFLIIQALEDGKKAYNEYKQDHRIEVLSHVMLCIIRAHGAKKYSTKAYRDYYTDNAYTSSYGFQPRKEQIGASEELNKHPKSSITQQAFNELLFDEKLFNGSLTLGEKLDQENYSRVIEGIKASLILSNKINLDGITFRNVKFKYATDHSDSKRQPFIKNTLFESCKFDSFCFDSYLIENSSFSHCLFNSTRFCMIQFSNVLFQNISAIENEWDRCTWTDITWKKCSIKDIHNLYSHFSNCVFSNSKLIGVDWRHNSINDLFITRSFLKNGLFYQEKIIDFHLNKTKMLGYEFCSSTISNFQGADSSLIKTIFFKCKIADSTLTRCQITQNLQPSEFKSINCWTAKPVPVVAYTCESDGRIDYIDGTKESIQMKEMGAAILRAYQPTFLPAPERLENEMELYLEMPYKPGVSLLRMALENAKPGSAIFEIREMAKEIADKTDLIILPPGRNVRPKLYGQSSQDYTEYDWRRTILEAALLLITEKDKKPVLGIGRGFDIINIFYGGDFKQKTPYIPEKDIGILSVEGDSPSAQFMKKAINGSSIQTGLSYYSFRHNVLGNLGTGLEKVMTHEGETKAFTNRKGLVGIDFYPQIAAYPKDEIEEMCENSHQALNPSLLGKNKHLLWFMLDLAGNKPIKPSWNEAAPHAMLQAWWNLP